MKFAKGIVLALLIGSVGISLYFYGSPRIELEESPTREREEAVGTLMQCLQVFRQIGESMLEEREPDMTLQCEPPSGPNILRREDEVLRVSHANPQMFGISGLYVTSLSPEPIVRP